ncbi:MAG: DMT family transporter [Proteobacteria bacterium]|nr:DMT family transporter [Pseudomonadota bacterium]
MKAKDIVDLILLAAVWGASFLFMRIGAPEFGPIALVQLRMLIAALFLLPILMLRVGWRELPGNWQPLTILGFCNSAIPFLLLSYSTLYVTAGFSSVINATAPLWGAVIAWMWLSERLPAVGVLGVLIGFAGVAVLAGDAQSLAQPGSTIAVIAAVGGAFFYGIGVNYARRFTRHLNSLSVATGSMLYPAILLAPFAVAWWPDTQPSLRGWMAIVAMGIASTGLAYILYFRLIANVGPAKAITVAYLIPVFAMLWGALLLGETVTGLMIIGCLIIFVGTALVSGLFRRYRTAADN